MEYCAYRRASRCHRLSRVANCPLIASQFTGDRQLPLVTLYVTERCNSRCVTCDYWRHGRDDMDLAAVTRLAARSSRDWVPMVLLSGGEPLLNPEWAAIAGY